MAVLAGETVKYPAWYNSKDGWCNNQFITDDYQTDEKGHAVLWFFVDPSPADAGIGTQSAVGKAPQVEVRLGDGQTATLTAEIISTDHWRVTFKVNSL